jgi:hypothetical protein
MGDGRIQKPRVGQVELPARESPDVALPSTSRRLDGRDPMQPITDPMRYVRDERADAAAQVNRTLKAWRARSGGAAGPAKIPAGGSGLPSELRAKMEPQLGADLSSVKVSTSGESAKAADQLGAKAFTVGQDVHFGAGQFAPGTKEGDRLLSHELTHTVQAQKSGVQRKAEPAGRIETIHDAPAPDPYMVPIGNTGDRVQRKAEAAEGEEHGAEHAPEVSQPHEAAEVEADKVGDQVADQLHGGGDKQAGAKAGQAGAAAPQKEGAEAAAHEAGREKAPKIGAKLSANTTVFRAPNKTTAPKIKSGGVARPSVKNPKLSNIVADLYKGANTPKPIGTGSTADAIRHEMATGTMVGGRNHTIKGQEYSTALAKWLKNNPTADPGDIAAATAMKNDLDAALRGN